MSCIMKNEKTIKSLDLSTNCPKRIAFEKVSNELSALGVTLKSTDHFEELVAAVTTGPVSEILKQYKRSDLKCSYCYVESARDKGFNAKIVIDKIEYAGEILRMKKVTIDKLNSTAGLRVFSFGDYIPWMYNDLMQICQDAKAVGLKLKAITKVPEFVELFHDHFSIIHISIDNVGCGVPLEKALELKAKYSNVLIRSAIMSEDDLAALEEVSDILTFNHATNGFKRFSPAQRIQYATVYPEKVCCVTSSCATCKIKCGIANVENRRNA